MATPKLFYHSRCVSLFIFAFLFITSPFRMSCGGGHREPGQESFHCPARDGRLPPADGSKVERLPANPNMPRCPEWLSPKSRHKVWRLWYREFSSGIPRGLIFAPKPITDHMYANTYKHMCIYAQHVGKQASKHTRTHACKPAANISGARIPNA
ncbi:hypothetical protein QBC35DRAFT_3276 [Podospora australis]|uniref:Secreted protein n=1 Tax=Podospora australis TaxID=1536484 RepID=A0AAN6X7T3_9PEZI|nr:hypothetical protein QBC35DRAFT_3276 [Podospora australis]